MAVDKCVHDLNQILLLQVYKPLVVTRAVKMYN